MTLCGLVMFDTLSNDYDEGLSLVVHLIQKTEQYHKWLALSFLLEGTAFVESFPD